MIRKDLNELMRSNEIEPKVFLKMRLFGWFSNTVHLKKMITYIQQKKNAGILKTQGFSKRRDSQNPGILKTQGFTKPRDKISSDLELQGIFFQGIPDPGQKNQGFEMQELI